MSTALKNEFESYVMELTTAICKEILLEKMESLCTKYENQCEAMGKSSSELSEASGILRTEAGKIDQTAKEIFQQNSSSLNALSQDIAVMENNMQTMFQEIRKLNMQNRLGFIKELNGYIGQYKNDIAQTMDRGYEKISDRLAGVITPEILQHFLDKLEEHTRQSKEIVGFINHTYTQEIEKNIQDLMARNQSAQDELYASIELYVNKVLSDLDMAGKTGTSSMNQCVSQLSNTINQTVTIFVGKLSEFVAQEEMSRTRAMEQQVELIRSLEPSEERFHALEEKIADLEQIIKKQETKSRENARQLEKFWDESVEKQKALEEQSRTNFECYIRKQEELERRFNSDWNHHLNEQRDLEERRQAALDDYLKEQKTLEEKLRTVLNDYIKKQVRLEQKRHTDQDLLERRAESLSWRIYMSFSNTLIICLFAALLILQKPWEVWGIEYCGMIAGGASLLIMMMSFVPKFIAKAIVRRRGKKASQSYEG